ncbi:uncharacterized protein EI90DRAFT_3057595 [Cantharellus anzutake]|uniref:uncharacterized protein n=1 Tax=Cantharellus anzutake TaxID=1750568 RepID=UPI001905CFB3|nr:uncharacterized protein EI90DRAFT_3057595 [Cantharellus anzutake]KAF8331342.1 hypothetical protein EI90DRAFT_3057595 [Cantharellus anzutake]
MPSSSPTTSKKAALSLKNHLDIWGKEFARNPKPSLARRENIAERSGKSLAQVNKWFEKQRRKDRESRAGKASLAKTNQPKHSSALDGDVDVEERILFSPISHVLGKLNVLYSHHLTVSRAKATAWADALEISGEPYPKDIIHRWLDWKRSQVAEDDQDDEDDETIVVDDRSRELLTPISPVSSPPRPKPTTVRSPLKIRISRPITHSTPHLPNSPSVTASLSSSPMSPVSRFNGRSLSDSLPSPFVTISSTSPPSTLSFFPIEPYSSLSTPPQFQSFKAFLKSRHPSRASIASNSISDDNKSGVLVELSRLEEQSRRTLDILQFVAQC